MTVYFNPDEVRADFQSRRNKIAEIAIRVDRGWDFHLTMLWNIDKALEQCITILETIPPEPFPSTLNLDDDTEKFLRETRDAVLRTNRNVEDLLIPKDSPSYSSYEQIQQAASIAQTHIDQLLLTVWMELPDREIP
jgi:hypothetical protein